MALVKPTLVIGGLGPASSRYLTADTLEAAAAADEVWLRTRRHPAAEGLTSAQSFDDVYDGADAIESVYAQIVERLVKSASKANVVYLVPGSPLVAEATVDLLRSDDRIDVQLLPAMSFLDLVWDRLGVDPFAAGPRLIDGRNFSIEAAGQRGPLLVSQCDAPWVLSKIKLAFETDVPTEVTVLQRLGLDDEQVQTVAWEDLDRMVTPDHLTSLWIADVAAPVGAEVLRMEEVARTLREKCPWDAQQTHAELSRYLLEETYETLEAIDALADADDGDEHLIEELGDLLYQVMAHTSIAAEEGRFTLADVAQANADKLIDRHPHVYGDVVAETADDVLATWESNKKKAKGRASVMEGIPAHLPALLYASKVLRKAQSAGVSLDPGDIEGQGLGAALLLLTDEVRRQGGDAEEELRRSAVAFRRRFERAEQLAAAEGLELLNLQPAEVQRFWWQAVGG